MTRGNKLITGLVAGAIIGAVAGLILAPKSGKEAREIVGGQVVQWRNRAGEAVGSLRERLRRGPDDGDSEGPSETGVQSYS